MKSLIASLVLVAATFLGLIAMALIFILGFPANAISTVILAGLCVGLVLLAINLHTGAAISLGEHRALFQLLVFVEALLALFPNAVAAIAITDLPVPDPLREIAFALLFPLALYYFLPASVFGKTFFLTETLVHPLGTAGLVLAVIFYGGVGFILVIGLHAHCKKLGARAGSHAAEESRTEDDN
jgi:hypothetical protein